jgi:fatty acid desaturase
MSRPGASRGLPPALLQELYQHSWRSNLKIPLFYLLLVAAGYWAWTTSSPWLRWTMYGCMGYLWMSVVTLMHDGTHDILFAARWKNWAFGIFSMIPLVVTFITFKEDHLEHHRFNRTAKDPDAFTMGTRSVLDFILFYAYILIGGVLTIVHFTVIYPLQKFNRRQWLIHGFELLLRVVVLGGLLIWTARSGALDRFLALWLIPGYVFTVLNSIRFIAEHYETPWNEGQLLGTRTIISNQVHSFFWNNINYHIGHHVYPGVPWHNLQKLHAALLPEIERTKAVVDPSYFGVLWNACRRGPESIERNARHLAKRREHARAAPALGG